MLKPSILMRFPQHSRVHATFPRDLANYFFDMHETVFTKERKDLFEEQKNNSASSKDCQFLVLSPENNREWVCHVTAHLFFEDLAKV